MLGLNQYEDEDSTEAEEAYETIDRDMFPGTMTVEEQERRWKMKDDWRDEI